MLAAARELRINGEWIAPTPSIVPSFSSKGFPEVGKIVEALSSVITDSLLVSAYDISYGHLAKAPQFAEYLILDSGGYECSKDMELSDKGNDFCGVRRTLILAPRSMKRQSIKSTTLTGSPVADER